MIHRCKNILKSKKVRIVLVTANVKVTLGLKDGNVPSNIQYDIPSNKLRGIIHEIHQTKWVEDLSVPTKADTFKSFKRRVNFEKYLEDVKNRKRRVAMTKIRSSYHNLIHDR